MASLPLRYALPHHSNPFSATDIPLPTQNRTHRNPEEAKRRQLSESLQWKSAQLFARTMEFLAKNRWKRKISNSILGKWALKVKLGVYLPSN